MKLKKGITINNQLEEGYKTIYINSGTELHSTSIAEHVDFNNLIYIPQFENNAYTVKKDWRNLDNIEEKVLRLKSKQKDYNTIYLGEIPDFLKECFKKLELQSFKSGDEITQKLRNEKLKTDELSTALNSFLFCK